MGVDIKISERQETPNWLVYGTPVFTIVAALAVSALALLAIDVSPVATYNQMFVETLTNMSNISTVLVRAAPLIFAGLGVYLPMKAGLWNIGAEGQLLMGAIVGTWIALNVSLSPVFLIPLMLFGAGLAGGLWAFIPALLRAKWGINEIITTLLFTFIAVDIQLYLVRGPMQGGFGGFPQTDLLPDASQFPLLTGMEIPLALLFALVAVGGVSLLMKKTRLGFQITFVGSNADAADQAGMSRYRLYLITLVVGGAMAALAGISEIAGNQGRLHASFEPGYGFTAIPIALLGRNGALRVLLAALFFALLFVGGNRVSVALEVPSALIDIIQALVILFLITAEFIQQYNVDVSLGKETDDAVLETEVATDG
jgi:simple sugar transport system permease protein